MSVEKKPSLPTFHWLSYPLNFKVPVGTSRGLLTKRETYFLIAESPNKDKDKDRRSHLDHTQFSMGEAGYLPGLTLDDWEAYSHGTPNFISRFSRNSEGSPGIESPALRFAWEMLSSKNYQDNCPKDFLTGKKGIPIHGLIWMGDGEFQRRQIVQFLDRGFTTLKLKIGGLNFSQELSLLDFLFREAESRKVKVTVRLDANGGLGVEGSGEAKASTKASFEQAMDKLRKLSHYPIHSIEQPLPPLYQRKVEPESYRQMYQQVIRETPIPIAWDEELIGIHPTSTKEKLLDEFRPHYLVLKPGIHGGFTECEEWIRLATERGIGWWATSALESNLGLTAIALWTATQLSRIPSTTDNQQPLTQGLGTGGLYTNNFFSPLNLKGDQLFYDHQKNALMRKDVLSKLGISKSHHLDNSML